MKSSTIQRTREQFYKKVDAAKKKTGPQNHYIYFNAEKPYTLITINYCFMLLDIDIREHIPNEDKTYYTYRYVCGDGKQTILKRMLKTFACVDNDNAKRDIVSDGYWLLSGKSFDLYFTVIDGKLETYTKLTNKENVND